MVAEQQAELSFAGLLRRLRAEAKLTRQELAAEGVSPRSTRQAAFVRPHWPPGTNGSTAERDQPSRPGRLLVVVDQFEELFIQCPDEGQRRLCIAALHAAATAGHGPDQAPTALVVLGMRAEFESRRADVVPGVHERPAAMARGVVRVLGMWPGGASAGVAARAGVTGCCSSGQVLAAHGGAGS